MNSNVDYSMPDELKSHVVAKFFEFYNIEADEHKQELDGDQKLKQQAEILKA